MTAHNGPRADQAYRHGTRVTVEATPGVWRVWSLTDRLPAGKNRWIERYWLEPVDDAAKALGMLLPHGMLCSPAPNMARVATPITESLI